MPEVDIFNSLALMLSGYSLFSALAIALAHFRAEHYQEQPASRYMGLLLLLALGVLQLAHFAWLYLDLPWTASLAYRLCLFAVAPLFFLFSQPLLRPQCPALARPALLAHLAPLLAAPWLPRGLALPLAFLIGAGYLLWLAHSLYGLRRERAGFQRELGLLGCVFLIAIGVALLSLSGAARGGKLFVNLYAIAIGLAFLLVQITLGLRPRLPAEVRETAQAAYASSTLGSVDCEAMLARLDSLMREERLYMDAELNLQVLAGRLGLSGHQLSELLNARLGKGFSRYLRELRVAAAQTMLCDEPSASVLSVGLGVGFTSQSNFYEAFRDIAGMTPGQFRKLHLPAK
ncbi:helix-turn-helix domain-containing protein [Massilia sp. BJB1822]|uniref:AraC family transcriptional regulator n=1 Tax=Massilia sp. BJB1822 TaxID=2744470 RepID=UPI001594A7D9|nr:helix-turn-helix domain-containing protein [Massilia sp. BJB1822]NVD99627.1 AraC family transcriptional regulator [Massilia sp. BJB1822]